MNESQRLDSWLWVARFFKTRSLARKAITGGHVRVNGANAKPARGVRAGDRLTITTPGGPFRGRRAGAGDAAAAGGRGM